MLNRPMALSSLIITVLVLDNCSSSVPSPGGNVHAQDYGAAITFSGEQIWSQSGTILGFLQRHTTIVHVAPGAGCPNVWMRGRKGIRDNPNAKIYVNGTAMVNTCVLRSLNTAEVRRIELYPMGTTRRSGYYTSSPGGLILIFTRNATS